MTDPLEIWWSAYLTCLAAGCTNALAKERADEGLAQWEKKRLELGRT